MEKNNGPFVPPETGPELFRKMREAVNKGNSPKEQPTIENPPQPLLPENKKTEKTEGNMPAPKKTLNFRNGASAMDDWQKEKESREDERWHKAA